ncbi:MAG: hypothetical protein QN155_03500 [Armatimonadota bacterium]|nr:hypothetical protein [Armatimonadota bacterium]MDR7404440.1 hypothetical protein [Armatimonadota bacterium]
MRVRDRELGQRRHRRERVRKLLARLQQARTAEEKQKILEKLVKRAPWRAAEFQRLAGELG